MKTRTASTALREPLEPARTPAPSVRAGAAQLGADELVLFEREAPAAPFPPGGAPQRRRFDTLLAIHACYAAEATTEGWLRGVVAALRTLAPAARWFEWSDGAAAPAAKGAAVEIVAAIGPECFRDLLRPSPAVQLLSHRLRSLPPDCEARVAEILRGRGLEDALLLFGGDVAGRPIILGMHAAPGVRPPSRTVGLLRHVAGHLNTARMLREHVRVPASTLEDGRSIASRAVTELVARGAFRWLDPDDERGRWNAFLRGAYALVDHWPWGSRRRRVLVRRCHAPGDPAALHPCETAALAQLAGSRPRLHAGDEPAQPASTIALHLVGARARLRCGSRDELASLLQPPRARSGRTSRERGGAPATRRRRL